MFEGVFCFSLCLRWALSLDCGTPCVFHISNALNVSNDVHVSFPKDLNVSYALKATGVVFIFTLLVCFYENNEF